MEKKNREELPEALGRAGHASTPVCPLFLTLLILGLAVAGCAAPGEPIERRPPVPTPIGDLTASQEGSGVVLTFTMPKETVQRLPLKSPPAVEIYRDFSPPGPASAKNLSLVVTIPPSLLAQYTTQGHIRYEDSLRPEDFAQHPGAQAVYSVRTRASEKKESDDSNLAALPLAVPPQPISEAKAQVTHDAILITWTAPRVTVANQPVAISGFRVYRSELEPAASGAAAEAPKRKAPLALVGESDAATSSFADAHFTFGTSYEYAVRSVFSSGNATLESDDSNLVDVTPRDIFPPSAPQGLEAVFVPAQGNAPASLDLSWAINSETDLAGYNVYRSEQEGARGERLNAELLRTPSFRDMNAVPGRRYFYTVTAVDTAGQESAASAAVSGGVPANSQ